MNIEQEKLATLLLQLVCSSNKEVAAEKIAKKLLPSKDQNTHPYDIEEYHKRRREILTKRRG